MLFYVWLNHNRNNNLQVSGGDSMIGYCYDGGIDGGGSAIAAYGMTGTVGVSAPLVAYNQKILEESATLRDIQNECRDECINDEVTGNIDELDSTVNELEECKRNKRKVQT